jgi:succinate dehydrogenase/fumarate reductase flavoprotein subunit
MDIDSEKQVTLLSMDSEFEANSIANELAANSIKALVIGGYTAGFRAEAPGRVSVVVRQADLKRAQLAFLDWEKNRGQTDWSRVDIGDPEGS